MPSRSHPTAATSPPPTWRAASRSGPCTASDPSTKKGRAPDRSGARPRFGEKRLAVAQAAEDAAGVGPAVLRVIGDGHRHARLQLGEGRRLLVELVGRLRV